MIIKEVLGILAVIIAIGSKIPYLHAVHKGIKKPHLFTWIIWGLTTSVIFFAQIYDGGGAGAWVSAVSAIIAFCVAVLGYIRNTRIVITRTDWAFFLTALCSLPLWYVTNDPLLSVILLVIVDVMGYFPTLRKAYSLPHEESAPMFNLQILKNVLSIAALENYTLVTLLFPSVICVMNSLVSFMVIFREKKQK